MNLETQYSASLKSEIAVQWQKSSLSFDIYKDERVHLNKPDVRKDMEYEAKTKHFARSRFLRLVLAIV